MVIIYSALILFYTLKFLSHKESIPSVTPPNLPINIITAAKNEEENIDKFLSCISSQNYQNSEFILVDDHSTDDTFSIASEYKKRYNFILCHNNGNGKKAALRTALTHCNAPYILFTDTDCYSNPQWASIMAVSAQHTKADIILAPLIIKADNPKSVSGPFCQLGRDTMANMPRAGWLTWDKSDCKAKTVIEVIGLQEGGNFLVCC
ncbi:MAG: glycosyltransferase family 2 protein, partial [Bacteroidales bacterium]|nr:glycosyltransferase family 2 protein [Bacteroidales bacterium]